MDNILEKINRAAVKFMVPLSPEETYKVIVREGVKLVNADDGSILIKTGKDIRTIFSLSKSEITTKPRRKGFSYEAITKRKAFVLQKEQFQQVHPEMVEQGVNSSIFIPLFYRNRSMGVLIVRSFKKKKLSEKELEILKIFGSMASLAIRNIQLLDETTTALNTRDLFISVASHELKTPLTAINGYVQILQKKAVTRNEKEAERLNNLERETRRLTKLIQELLEMNQIRTGSFHFNLRDCKLPDILSQAIENFNFVYPSRKINFINAIPDNQDTIVGDPDKLVQVLTNILHNAAKFSNPKHDIMLSLLHKNHYAIIQIEDTGIGISKTDLPRIFTGFYKGKSGSREGMGLGLYIAKTIVTEHRGDILITSSEGIGTKVEIKLPLAKV